MAEMTSTDLGLPQLKKLMDKQFWQRPEGSAAKFILGIMGVGAVIVGASYANALGLYILSVLQTWTQIGLHIAGLATAFFLVTSERVRTLVGAMFRSAVRSVTGIFVNMAPVAVLRDYVAQSKKHLAKAQGAVKAFKAKMLTVKAEITRLRNEIEKMEASAKEFLNRGDMEEASAKQTRAERIRGRMKALEEMYAKMETLAKALTTIMKKASLKLENVEAEMEDRIKFYEVSQDARAAIANVRESVSGSGTRQEMADMAAAAMALEISQAVVEIDEMIDLSEQLFSGVDAEEALMSQRALKRFEEWQSHDSQVLGPGGKAALIAAVNNPNMHYDATSLPTSRQMKSNLNIDEFFG